MGGKKSSSNALKMKIKNLMAPDSTFFVVVVAPG